MKVDVGRNLKQFKVDVHYTKVRDHIYITFIDLVLKFFHTSTFNNVLNQFILKNGYIKNIIIHKSYKHNKKNELINK